MLKPVHQVESFRVETLIVYVCKVCDFERQRSLITGRLSTINHGDTEAVHIGGEIVFEYDPKALENVGNTSK